MGSKMTPAVAFDAQGTSTADAGLRLTAYGATPGIVQRKANVTSGSSSKVIFDQSIARHRADGYVTATGFVTVGNIACVATEDYDTGHSGSSWVFQVNADNDPTHNLITGMTLGQDKSLTVEGGVGMNGVAAPAKAAHIADATDLASCITAINAILVVLEDIGAVATS